MEIMDIALAIFVGGIGIGIGSLLIGIAIAVYRISKE